MRTPSVWTPMASGGDGPDGTTGPNNRGNLAAASRRLQIHLWRQAMTYEDLTDRITHAMEELEHLSEAITPEIAARKANTGEHAIYQARIGIIESHAQQVRNSVTTIQYQRSQLEGDANAFQLDINGRKHGSTERERQRANQQPMSGTRNIQSGQVGEEVMKEPERTRIANLRNAIQIMTYAWQLTQHEANNSRSIKHSKLKEIAIAIKQAQNIIVGLVEQMQQPSLPLAKAEGTK